ncbi:MAG TPA: M6 family metalloprotease domain-containing protein [Dermatophilaceae bacterium]|nr:M6 family metalloprotease domain-containing protein [Dermatophilaceae bacterium]
MARQLTAPDFCAVAPSPDLTRRLRERGGARGITPADVGSPRYLGFNDGVILPPSRFPKGATARQLKWAAADRAPLTGDVRVIVVLAEFTDKKLGAGAADRFKELFFSQGTVPTGSVQEYYNEVTGGKVNIVGEVVGPYTMPKKLSWYANGNFGIGKPTGEPRANILAQDAAKAADADVDYGPYDNDGNGYVDAFIVVHAGRGGEETGDSGDIWSHKWVLPAEYQADAAKIFAYLTVPEDAKLGVCAHELGHLLFGFPDLYDIDGTSEGVGNWCLMAAGSWNGGGDTPAHPSAWCKVKQDWATVVNVTEQGEIAVEAVTDSKTVYRLWTDGADSQEYFLLENRQQAGYDTDLPGAGLLLWHVDDAQQDNSDESHYLVGLLQADGSMDLEHGTNRGDSGDQYPGSADNRAADDASTPSTHTYAGQESGVSVRDIPDSSSSMTVSVAVSGEAGPGPTGDVEARVAALEEQLSKVQDALSAAADGLGQARAMGARAWSPRSRT